MMNRELARYKGCGGRVIPGAQPADYISNHERYQLGRDQKLFLRDKALRGVELVDNVARLCAMNLFLHVAALLGMLAARMAGRSDGENRLAEERLLLMCEAAATFVESRSDRRFISRRG
jgi:hypothetical protein